MSVSQSTENISKICCLFGNRKFKFQVIVFYNINVLIKSFNLNYDSTEWRLFIDFSKLSLKAVLIYNGNSLPFIYVGHAILMSQTYANMTALIYVINYAECVICGDLKVIAVLLGIQPGYNKYCCFLCM